MVIKIIPSGIEIYMQEDDLIVSRTDRKGLITYSNRLFVEFSGYSEKELLGTPHNIIRHPDMPRAMFKLLWEKISHGQEVFAYIINLNKIGNHYWVFAHITPTYDANNNIVGYHSNRRKAKSSSIEIIKSLYLKIMKEQNNYTDPKVGLNKSYDLMLRAFEAQGMSYEEFMFSI